MGRARAVGFHSARLLRWAWSTWREVSLGREHRLNVAFEQVELFGHMTQTVMGPSTNPASGQGSTEALLACFCEGLAQGFLSFMCQAVLI